MSDEIPPNSALDVKLDFISDAVKEIKIDIREIKNDYVIRRELNEALKTLRAENEALKEDVKFLKKIVYSVAAFVFIAIGAAVLKLIIK